LKVAVLDLTHGGVVIARKLSRIVESVVAIDVYKTLDQKTLNELEKEGIRVYRDAMDADYFDLLIAPVHLDTAYPMLLEAERNEIPVISHHSAVGELLSYYNLENKTIIEVTGTKAKTSTALLLANILSKKKKVVSHTSRGVEDWSTGRLIKKGLSITPASILTVMDMLEEYEVETDVVIFEISLGGTGCADIGVITTIYHDYPIANNTKMASEAKQSMILNAKHGSTLVIHNQVLKTSRTCRNDLKFVSFCENGNPSCNVYYDNKAISYNIGERYGRINIPETSEYDMDSYRIAFTCATAVALAFGIDELSVEHAIREFRGAEGRMKKSCIEGRTLIDNSNSGMNMGDVEKALRFAKSLSKRIVMVLGEEARQVCEGLEPDKVKRFIDNHLHELDALILVGERMRSLAHHNIYYADSLSQGIELAKKLTHEKDTILSCVKCFR